MLLLLAVKTFAEVGSTMNLGIHVINNSDISNESVEYLKDRIGAILSQNGINSALHTVRFYIVAKPTVVSRSVTNGEPSMVSNKITITYRIGDVIDNHIFATFTESYHGVGQSEEKAWMNALTKVSNNQHFTSQLQTAKKDISNYYDRQSASLIDIAKSQAQTNNYDAALATLSVIPPNVKNYELVCNAIVDIYRSKCVFQNEQALLLAKRSWATSPNIDGAKAVCRELSGIESPSLDVLKQMDELYSKIERSLGLQDKREFELLKQKIANEQELAIHNADNEATLWSTAIQLGYDFLNRQVKPINIISSLFTW